MGAGLSSLELQPLPYNAPVFALSFHCPDRLLLVHHTAQVYETLRSVLSKMWDPPSMGNCSVSSRFPGNTDVEIKLPGSPFRMAVPREETVRMKLCLCELLQNWFFRGWKPFVSSDLSRRFDLSTIFFQQMHYDTKQGHNSSLPHIICLSLSRGDSLQLINHQNNVSLIRALEAAVSAAYSPGLQQTTARDDTLFELKLCGFPWMCAGTHNVGISARLLLLEIVARFESAAGYRFYVNADLKGTSDCLFFIRSDNDGNSDNVLNFSGTKLEHSNFGYGYSIPLDTSPPPYHVAVATGLTNTTALVSSGFQPFAGSNLISEFQPCTTSKSGYSAVSDFRHSMDPNSNSSPSVNHSFAFNNNYFMLSLNSTDLICLIGAPDHVRRSIGAVLQQRWHRGIQNTTDYCDNFQYKLKGTPFCADGKDAVWTRYMMTFLFQELLHLGWAVYCTLDISRNLTDKSVFIFKKQSVNNSQTSVNPTVACVSLNMTDTVRLIRFPSEDVSAIHELIAERWSAHGFVFQQYAGQPEFKLNGNPWGAYAINDEIMGRSLFCAVLVTLQRNGWRVISSADVSSKYHRDLNNRHNGHNVHNVHNRHNRHHEYPLDVHSLFLVKYRLPEEPIVEGPSPPYE